MNREIITIENSTVSVPASKNIWMSGYELAGLFGCCTNKISANIRAILKTGVLREPDVCRTYYYRNGNSVVQYGLEMIIALSFRIKSGNADLIRRWIAQQLVSSQLTNLHIPLLRQQHEWN